MRFHCTLIIFNHVRTCNTEDPADLGLVKTGMVSVLQADTQHALSGIFEQIMGDDETVREKGIEYVCTSLSSMRHKLFIPHPENEKFLLELIKKVKLTLFRKGYPCPLDLNITFSLKKSLAP